MVAIARLYPSSYSNLNDQHEIISRFDWPCYDVFGFKGGSEEKVTFRDISCNDIGKRIKGLQEDPEIGVIGVSEIGINETDAAFIAKHGVGIL